MTDQTSGSGSSTGHEEPPEFLEQVVARTIASLREQAGDLYKAGGEQAEALAAASARVALWLAGLRPGGLRMIRLVSGYEVELTPQDPLGFVRHLTQALVGEACSGPSIKTAEEAAAALALEVNNAVNQVTQDIAPFVVRALLWQECGPILQEMLRQRQEQEEVEARRGSGKRDEPPASEATTPEATDTPKAQEQPEEKKPRIVRPGEPDDDNPPPLLIFPGRH